MNLSRYKRTLQCFTLFVFAVLCWPVAHAFSSLPSGSKPMIIQTGLYLDHIVAIDEATETMRFNATLTMRWQDERLAFSKYIAGVSTKNYDTHGSHVLLPKMWHPQVDLIDLSGPRLVRMMNISVTSDGVVTWTEEFEASTSIVMNLHQFPFDRQVIKLSMQPFLENASVVRLAVMKSTTGVSKSVHLQGWKVLNSYALAKNEQNQLYHQPFSRYTLLIKYKRLSIYYVHQLFVPVSLIVLLSFSVFWMLKNPLVNRVAISLTAVLTIVVFQWRILTKLPSVNYHTFADIFMLISFFVAASTVVASIILDHITAKKRKFATAKIFRIVYPVVYFLLLIVLALFYY